MDDGDIAFLFLAVITIAGTVFSWVAFGVDADTPTDEDEIYTDIQELSGYYMESNNVLTTRQMNGTIWAFTLWKDAGDSTVRKVYAQISDDNGSTWNLITIIDSELDAYDPAGYPGMVFGAVALSNNSIILGVSDYKYWGSTGWETSVWCHWNNSNVSQWEPIQIRSWSSYIAIYGGIAVNETDGIMLSIQQSTNLYIYSFFFDPETRGSSEVTGHIVDIFSLSYSPRYYIFWNVSDSWILCYGDDATPYRIRRFVVTPAGHVELTQITLTTGYTRLFDLVYYPDDVYVFTFVLASGSAYWHNQIRLGYFNITNNTQDFYTINTEAYWGFGKLSLNNENISQDRITFKYWNYNTDSFWVWYGYYWDERTSWWDAVMEEHFTETENLGVADESDMVISGMDSLYPVDVDGNHTQLPAYYGAFVLRDFDSGGGPDRWANYNITWAGIKYWTYGGSYGIPDVQPGDGPGGNETTESVYGVWWDSSCVTSAIIIFIVVVIMAMVYNKT